MTWKELKDKVDAELRQRGIGEDVEIWYLDAPNWGVDDVDDIHISYDEKLGLSVS